MNKLCVFCGLFFLCGLVFISGCRYQDSQIKEVDMKYEKIEDTNNYQRPEESKIKFELNSLEYQVIMENGTERAFQNEYWNHHEKGIYVDKLSGEPLFSSEDKFDSGTGWPSFTRPIHSKFIKDLKDDSYGMDRTEVRSSFGDSHLGHVFNDGPGSSGQRYCINSASLRFIPYGKMEEEGYGAYLRIFEE